jgi:hypothetical protein
MEEGETTPFAIMGVQERGLLFIEPKVEVGRHLAAQSALVLPALSSFKRLSFPFFFLSLFFNFLCCNRKLPWAISLELLPELPKPNVLAVFFLLCSSGC